MVGNDLRLGGRNIITLSPRKGTHQEIVNLAHQKTDILSCIASCCAPLSLSPKDSVVRGSEVMHLHLSVGILGMQLSGFHHSGKVVACDYKYIIIYAYILYPM